MSALKLPSLLLILFFAQSTPPPVSPPATPSPSAFRISGRVIDAISGQPLSRASVFINPANSPDIPAAPDSGRFTITDSEGLFAFADVAPGKYTLSARHRNYLPQMYQQHESFTTAVVVGPGFESENLVFTLRPGASISGIIADESDDPIRHADVMLYRQLFAGGRRRTLQVRRTNSDDQGQYHFSHLSPGTYFVAVMAQPWYAQHPVRHSAPQQQGFISHMQFLVEENQALDVVYPLAFYSNAGDLSGATPIALHSGDMAVADFRMRPIPAIHVLVKTSATDAEQNTSVTLSQSIGDNDSIFVPIQTSLISPGVMEVSGVPQGRFNLQLNTQNGNAQVHRSQSVQLGNDAEVDATRNSSPTVVSGSLQVEDGSPVSQPARVLLRKFVSGESFNTAVSAAGEFSFKDNPVEPGKYEIIIIEPPGLFIRNLTSENAKTSGRSFEITSAEDVSITIHAAKGNGRITGVALKKDKPASGVMIVLAPLDLNGNPALFRRDQSDSDGSFTLNAVVPGKYTLMALENGWDLEWGDPSVLQKFIAGGESVQIAPKQKTEIRVNVQ
jgi:protocatechuate 3,4-dioxygenase beta subunit